MALAWLWAAPLVGAGISAITQGINNRRMLKYNSPKMAVRRLRDAGLPYAAYAAGQTGNQSTPVPGTDMGLGSLNQNIGQYQTNKKTIEEVSRLKEEIKDLNMRNQKTSGELQWYLSGAGTDTSRTNLTSMLGMQQQQSGANVLSTNIANEMARKTANNLSNKIMLDNAEQNTRIRNMIQQNIKGGYEIEGIKLDNALKAIENKYRPGMREAELDGLLTRNGISVTEDGIKKLELELARATQGNKIAMSDMDIVNKELTWEVTKEHFTNYKQYQMFVQQVQDELNKPAWEVIKDPIARIKAIVAFAYTSAVGGGGEGKTNLLQYLPK